jgi:hypothetical protein
MNTETIQALTPAMHYRVGMVEIRAALDEALDGMRYPEDPEPEQAEDFITIIASRPVGGVEFCHEAISESSDAEFLSLIRLVDQEEYTAAGELVGRMLTRYATALLVNRMVEVG